MVIRYPKHFAQQPLLFSRWSPAATVTRVEVGVAPGLDLEVRVRGRFVGRAASTHHDGWSGHHTVTGPVKSECSATGANPLWDIDLIN